MENKMSDLNWVERYRPETWGEIQGNNKNLKKLKKWARNWSKGSKAQILEGGPGTGKTTTAYVMAKQMGWELNQVNASSARKTEDLKQIAKETMVSTIDGGNQLILLDEVDSFDSSVNTTPLLDALSNPRNPILMTANDAYDIPSGIKRKVKSHGRNNYLKFKLSKASRRAKLNDIVQAEDLDLSDDHIDVLAEREDLRSAINDLQLYYETDKVPGDDDREMDMNEWQAVDNILRGKKDLGYNISPNDFVIWLDENVSDQFRGLECAMAYKSLAYSDKWLGVAMQRDHRFWKYAAELQEQVANLRLTEPYDGYLDKDFPAWFRTRGSSVNDDTPEARVYSKLKSLDKGAFEFAGNYQYFRKVLLPILQSLDSETKYELAMENRLVDQELEVLGISEEGLQNWKSTEDKDGGDVTQSNALDW